MESKTFTLIHQSYDDSSGILDELIYEAGDIRFRFTTSSYLTDPMDVVAEIISLDLSIEKKIKDDYKALGKKVEIEEWEDYLGLGSSDQPLSWPNMCQKLVHLLVKSYSEFNKNTPITPDAYYKERLSKLGYLSFAHPIKDWNSSDLNRVQKAFVAAESENYTLIDLLIIHKLMHFEGEALKRKSSIGAIFTTTIGNILLKYVPYDASAPEQIDTIYEMTLNAYLRKEGKDELLCSISNFAEFSYTPAFATPNDYKHYIEVIDQFEFKLLNQLDLNQSKNLGQYLVYFFRSKK
ncbi:MAG: hypothetical protein AB8E82_18310 [Aureispira sp.]